MRPGEYLLCLLAVLATSLPTQGMVFATQMEGGCELLHVQAKILTFPLLCRCSKKANRISVLRSCFGTR